MIEKLCKQIHNYISYKYSGISILAIDKNINYLIFFGVLIGICLGTEFVYFMIHLGKVVQCCEYSFLYNYK